MFLVNISVVLNLLSVWIKFKIILFSKVGNVSGSVMCRKIWYLFVLRLWVFFLICIFVIENFVFVDWYISGNVIIVEVMIVVVDVNIIDCWNNDLIYFLIGLLFLKMIMRKKLIIVGGSIIGNKNMVFNSILYCYEEWVSVCLIIVFKIVMRIVVYVVIFKDRKIGDKIVLMFIVIMIGL